MRVTMREREEPKMQKMGSDDDEGDGGRLQTVVLETLSPQFDEDDRAELGELLVVILNSCIAAMTEALMGSLAHPITLKELLCNRCASVW
jgi:hypothetical protein